MHERAAVTRALAELISAADTYIIRVEAKIGVDADPEVVRSTWSQAAAGTRAHGAVLICESALDVLMCLRCGESYDGDKLALCPACNGNGLVIEMAPEFTIASWEAA